MTERAPTIPERIEALLIRAQRAVQIREIVLELGDVSRPSVNRALGKLQKRKKVHFRGRTVGWMANAVEPPPPTEPTT